MTTKIPLAGYYGEGLPGAIFQGWIDAQQKYADVVDEAPWAYNERASISMLAAGCWLAGGIAVEEFATRKGHTDRRFTSDRPGRGDLWIRYRKQEFWCEAKWRENAFPSYKKWDLKGTIGSLRESLLDAANDAFVAPKDQGQRKSLLFVSVYQLGNRNDKLKVSTAWEMVDSLRSNLGKIGATGMAWHFSRKWIFEEGYENPDGRYGWELGGLLFVGNPKRKS